MTLADATASLTGGVALIERALAYTLGGLMLVTPDAMSNRTPCRDWDLRSLLLHMNDSLRALDEAVTLNRVGLDPDDRDTAGDYGDPGIDPVASLRARGCRMIGTWANAREPGDVSIADRSLSASIVAATGAVEVAVHGWDLARACGQHRPIPPALAEELLDLAPLLVGAADRASRFADPVDVSLSAGPSERLLAYLGRRT
ncbi:MAG: TIGR03086 family metal-binding protein [Actinomycetes bacterium]